MNLAEVPCDTHLILDFVNSAERRTGTDAISTSVGLCEWLTSHGLLSSDVHLTLEDIAAVIELRDAVRELIWMNSGGSISAPSIEILNRAARSAPLTLSISQAGISRLEPSPPGLEGAIGRIMAAIFTSMADPSWPRVKLCRNTRCRRAYYDRSKNRSRVWCEMAICGNRAKAAAHRDRLARGPDGDQARKRSSSLWRSSSE